MRTENLTQEKLKNSGIYFQIGLIAALAFTYVALEYKVKTNELAIDTGEVYKPSEEDIFVYNPIEPKTKVPKPQVVKPIKQVVKTVSIEKLKIVKYEPKVAEPVKFASEKPNEPIVTTPEPVGNPVENPTPPDNKIENMLAVEELPMFEGCVGLSREEQKACFDEQMKKHLNKTIKYPETALENEEQGTILVAFVIDTQGKITNIKAVERGKKLSESLKQEAIRAISKTPKLRPGKHGDKAVNVSYMIPVTFKM